jgi:hypothetical protein
MLMVMARRLSRRHWSRVDCVGPVPVALEKGPRTTPWVAEEAAVGWAWRVVPLATGVEGGGILSALHSFLTSSTGLSCM